VLDVGLQPLDPLHRVVALHEAIDARCVVDPPAYLADALIESLGGNRPLSR
jgi:hypothetical protein